jgi:hypothetical protein
MKASRAFLAMGLFAPAALAWADAVPRDNVIVLGVRDVQVPENLPGQCNVTGAVREVWDGADYRIGQPVSIEVPCMVRKPVLEKGPAVQGQPSLPSARPPPAPSAILPLDTVVLKQSATAVVHLDNAGKLIWTPTERAYNRVGPVAGYVVLSGATVPLASSDQLRPARL